MRVAKIFLVQKVFFPAKQEKQYKTPFLFYIQKCVPSPFLYFSDYRNPPDSNFSLQQICTANLQAYSKLTRQECKCETSLQQVNTSFEVTMGRTCSKLAVNLHCKLIANYSKNKVRTQPAQLREYGDIAAEINGSEEDEEEVNDDEEDAAEVPPTHTVALETSETLRDYFQFNSGSKGIFSRLDELEKTVFENSQKQKQFSIVNYFVRE
ncbi:hypothetical protein AVEN_147587-1 [Araneus ventricosus]|uniref:Uncharacterized protein n=1 Tax=Araneus ventricosus TaxID=182803 RepID=A0A4Y2H188_ARAVE|nr:hypothetical protein AVEN_147587-1 [Araneus ventricosus]